MLVMPILNTGKNGTTRIYNVMISLKTASKVRENTVVNGSDDEDVVIGSSSFNNSLYNTNSFGAITNLNIFNFSTSSTLFTKSSNVMTKL